MQIISNEFSWLSFNGDIDNDCNDDKLLVLPVCTDLSIKAQFEVESEDLLETTNKLYVAVTDVDCNVLYDDDIEVTPLCGIYKWTSFDGDANLPDDDINSICNTGGLSEELVPYGDFSSNPFSEILSDELIFDFNGATNSGQCFTLYIDGKVIVFRFTPIGIAPIINGNTFIFSILNTGFDSDRMLRLKDSLVANLDPLVGTTTSYVAGTPSTYTILNVPSGSHLYNEGALLTSVTTITAQTISTANNCYYNAVSGNMQYLNIDNYTFTEMRLRISVSLTTDLGYRSIFDYNTPSLIDYTFNVVNSSAVTVYTSTENPLLVGDNTKVNSFICPATDDYIIEYIFDNQFSSPQISFDNLSIVETQIMNVISSNDSEGYTPIETGIFTVAEIHEMIESLTGKGFDCEFESCCDQLKIQFTVLLADDVTEIVHTLTRNWKYGYIDFPEVELSEINEECFRYAILDENKDLITCSNLFKKEYDCCEVTKIIYSGYDNSFGFIYNDEIENSIQLPFYLHSPIYPTTEKIYRNTNGSYSRLATDIEKEYNCETDFMTDVEHDKLIVALKHDKLRFISQRANIDGLVMQEGDYKPDWNRKTETTARAEFKIKKLFNGKSANCGTDC